jgi:hypothetical protein
MRLQGWFVRLGVLLALAALGVLGLSASAVAAGITVDQSTGGPSSSLTIETSQPNELILIAGDGWPASETPPTVTVDGSAAGLISFEASEAFNSGGASVFQFVAPSAGLHTIEVGEGGYCCGYFLNFAASLLGATNTGLTSTSLSVPESLTMTASIATSTPDQYVFATSTQNTVHETLGVVTWEGAPETPTLLQSSHANNGIDSSIAGFNAPTPGTYSATVSDSVGVSYAGGVIILVAVQPACSAVEGTGFYLKSGQVGRVTVRDKLSTNTLASQQLQVSNESGTVRFGLTKLTKAECVAIPGGLAFSGEGPARNYKKSGYTAHVSLSIKEGHAYFSAKLTKGATVINEATGEPLSKSNEVIH